MNGQVVRVFESEEDYRASGMATGEDGLDGDPHASFATWPGKHNIGRPAGNKVFACPAHPLCGCSWISWVWTRAKEIAKDWFADFSTQEINDYVRRRAPA